MKKIVLLFVALGMLFCAKNVMAESAKIQFVEAPTTVAASSNTWTAVPSTTTVDASRLGIMFDAVNDGEDFKILLSTTPDPAPTATEYFIYKGSDSLFDLSISGFVYMFMKSSSTTKSHNINVQEYRGTR